MSRHWAIAMPLGYREDNLFWGNGGGGRWDANIWRKLSTMGTGIKLHEHSVLDW
ncbi:hypothetical protein FHU41_000479 [Psychromicrobium silvestre]|uniref:Uncharacterized protein n=1 Tax=Psychromicrobium silvestre TaxID=1645614 RepID=A0A7Y9LRI1_9MICC|nr:hypothetical protein [Psychromicrobium silvestre]